MNAQCSELTCFWCMCVCACLKMCTCIHMHCKVMQYCHHVAHSASLPHPQSASCFILNLIKNWDEAQDVLMMYYLISVYSAILEATNSKNKIQPMCQHWMLRVCVDKEWRWKGTKFIFRLCLSLVSNVYSSLVCLVYSLSGGVVCLGVALHLPPTVSLLLPVTKPRAHLQPFTIHQAPAA